MKCENNQEQFSRQAINSSAPKEYRIKNKRSKNLEKNLKKQRAENVVKGGVLCISDKKGNKIYQLDLQ